MLIMLLQVEIRKVANMSSIRLLMAGVTGRESLLRTFLIRFLGEHGDKCDAIMQLQQYLLLHQQAKDLQINRQRTKLDDCIYWFNSWSGRFRISNCKRRYDVERCKQRPCNKKELFRQVLVKQWYEAVL